MNLTRIAVNNPAAVLAVTILLLIAGAISAIRLPIQLVPDITRPEIRVNYAWRAAAPQELESEIIEPQENVLKNTPGVVDVVTNIHQSFGDITLYFAVGTDMDQALMNVISQLNHAPDIPLEADEPVITSGPGNAVAASIMIVPSDGRYLEDFLEYEDLMDSVVYSRLQRVNGVAKVDMEGRSVQELRITFDPFKLSAHGIQLSELAEVISSSSSDVSGGFANVGRRRYTVRFAGKYDVASLENMIIKWQDDQPIYVRDVATVGFDVEDLAGVYMRDGKPAYYIRLSRSNDSNLFELITDLKVAIRELNEGPLANAGLRMELSMDTSVHIKNAITLVNSNLSLGVLLAIGILWLFMRGMRSIFIIALTIPVSLMLSFIVLSLMGRTINVISLAGVAFAVGLVLDAAIVVQENIARLRGESESVIAAITKGAGQVSGALFASTATTIVIFVPIIYLEGVEGQLFTDLAITLSVAVFSSFISAITLIPVANQWLMSNVQERDEPGPYWRRLSEKVTHLTDSSGRRIALIAVLTIGASVFSVGFMPQSDFLPKTPINAFSLLFNAPAGMSIDTVEHELMDEVNERLFPYMSGQKQPEIAHFNFYSGYLVRGSVVYPKNEEEIYRLMDELNGELFRDMPDISFFMFRRTMLTTNRGNERQVMINIQGSDLNTLIETAVEVEDRIRALFDGININVLPGKHLNEPELRFIPNDERITRAGLTRMSVARSVQAFTDGLFIGEYFDGNRRFDIILRASDWQYPESLEQMPLHSPDAGTQMLGELAAMERTVGPGNLRRVNGLRSVTLAVSPPETMAMETLMDQIDKDVIHNIQSDLPAGVSIAYDGKADELKKAINQMVMNFMFALLVLLVLMAVLFQSLKDAILVIAAMPLAVAGGVLGLLLLNLFTHQTLDLLTMIGFIILLGLVVNNAILLVDRTRNGENSGLSRRDAVSRAVSQRARAIYMSTLTSIVGMLPLMLMPGPGSEIYQGLATVIVGGMTFSAIFTLILLPALLRLGESTFSSPESVRPAIATPIGEQR